MPQHQLSVNISVAIPLQEIGHKAHSIDFSFVASDQPGNTYLMTVHSDYHIATWGPYTLDGIAYSGMTVLGFLHHTSEKKP